MYIFEKKRQKRGKKLYRQVGERTVTLMRKATSKVTQRVDTLPNAPERAAVSWSSSPFVTSTVRGPGSEIGITERREK